MPIHAISNFVSAFSGGSRPNRFRIREAANNEILSRNANAGVLFGLSETHAMATSLPESTVGVIPIPFRGRIYKFPGDRDYLPWQVTILDDTGNNATYKAWHDWSNEFNNHVNNTSSSRAHKEYYKTLFVQHLDHNSDNDLRTFRLLNCWPMQVGPIELNMAKGNEVVSFTCQLAYTHYTVVDNSAGIGANSTSTPASTPSTPAGTS